jgi:hypothetical protein
MREKEERICEHCDTNFDMDTILLVCKKCQLHCDAMSYQMGFQHGIIEARNQIPLVIKKINNQIVIPGELDSIELHFYQMGGYHALSRLDELYIKLIESHYGSVEESDNYVIPESKL